MGLTDKMIAEILEGAKVARHTVLDVMLKALPESRKEVSQFAPKVMVITVPKDKIGEVIGPGGKNIRGMSAQTETDINIEEDGTVTITGLHKEKVEEAANIISSMTREVEVGEEFTGVVKRMLPFGAFVEILPGKEGLVHVSKMGAGFVRTPEDVVSIGQEVKVVSGEKSYPSRGEFRNNTCNGAEEHFVDVESIPENIRDIAVRASGLLGLSWSRADIIIDKLTGLPYLLEVNRYPGITALFCQFKSSNVVFGLFNRPMNFVISRMFGITSGSPAWHSEPRISYGYVR
jgi:ribosomal protein L6P/L9E